MVVWLTLPEGRQCPRAPSICEIKPPTVSGTPRIRDDETEVALREMAARYVAEADDIESRELATRQMKETANFYDDTA